MKGDLISREALKKAIEECQYCGFYGNLIEIIDNAPTVDINTNDIEYKAYCKGLEDGKKIARPQGKRVRKGYEPYGVCSVCGELRELDNFCGNCGADMRKGSAKND